jgi:peptide chain release factor 1
LSANTPSATIKYCLSLVKIRGDWKSVAMAASSLEDKLKGIEARYIEIDNLLADPAILATYDRVAALAQEKSGIEPVVTKFREYRKALADFRDARAMLNDPELGEMAREEFERLEKEIPVYEQELKTLLLPKDHRDEKT